MPDIIPFKALVIKENLLPGSQFKPLESLKKELFTDTEAHFYLYLQYFKIPEQDKELCRKGIIGLVRENDLQQILKHENTITENVQVLVNTILNSGLSLEPVHTFHQEKNEILNQLSEEDLLLISQFSDDNGVQNQLYKLINPLKALNLQQFYRDKTLFIADGHHRFQAHQELSRMHPEKSGNLPVYICDINSCPEKILPVHRLLKLTTIEKKAFLLKLSDYFSVTPCELTKVQSEIQGKMYSFGLFIEENTYVLKLKEGLEEKIFWPFHDLVKKINVTVLHYYAFEKAAGIRGSMQKDSKQINFSSIFTECISLVRERRADAAFFCNPVEIKDVVKVAKSGHVLPQKSTCFYPKVNSGLLFASVD